MIRKEPPLTLKSKKTSAEQHSSSSLEDSAHKHTSMSDPKERLARTGYSNKRADTNENMSSKGLSYASKTTRTISIKIPLILYFTAFILAFLKKINYDLPAFLSVLQTPKISKDVAIMELVIGPLLQAAIFFIVVAFLLWCIRLFGIGKSLNFRRVIHTIFAALFNFALLIPPSI